MEQLKLLKAFLPKGDFWTIGTKLEALLECLATELEILKTYIKNIKRESIVTTAEDTTDEWLLALNIKDTGDSQINRKLLTLYSSAIGGQSIEYLNKVIQEAYPDFVLTLRDDKTTLLIDGVLKSNAEYSFLVAFCKQVFPAYCLIYTFIKVEESYGQYSECGIATCGASECGYGSYVDTSGGFYGECGEAVSGVAQCGYYL